MLGGANGTNRLGPLIPLCLLKDIYLLLFPIISLTANINAV